MNPLYFNNTPELRLINVKTEHRCVGNSFDAFDTHYEFVNMNKKPYDKGRMIEYKVRMAIGQDQKNWHWFKANGYRFWEQGSKNKSKKEFENLVKNWFDFNGLPWEAINSN